jgi:hypothetical protein
LHLLNPDIARASASRDFAEAADSVRKHGQVFLPARRVVCCHVAFDLTGAGALSAQDPKRMRPWAQVASGRQRLRRGMMVQVVPASYHEEPKLAKSFQAMPSLRSPAASQQTAVALLKEVLSRRK